MKHVLILLGVALLSLTTGCLGFLWPKNQVPPLDDGTRVDKRIETERELYPGSHIRVAVSVLGEPVFPEEIKEISAQYEIMMPLLGVVSCQGLKLRALEEKLAKDYATYFRDPTVSVYYVTKELADGTSPFGSVLVTGEVNKPGHVSIPSTRDLTLLRAIQLAGGTTRIANTRKVQLTRGLEDGKKAQYRIDMLKIGEEGADHLNVTLKAGDVIFVPESWM